MRRAVWSVALFVLGLLSASLLPWPKGAPSPIEPSVIDVGFSQHMSQHHDQAILLSNVFQHGHESALVAFAQRVREAQLLEVGTMRGWLSLWQFPLLPRSRSMDWLRAGKGPITADLEAYLLSCQNAESGMPGMASRQDIEKLQQARGESRDRLFLQLLQRHHAGGLPMLHFAVQESEIPAVRQLAERMLVEQGREMLLIQAELQRLSAGG